ncbi:MAG: hypothetical protein GY749_39440 [Desulfobacteraceae bacterium]|nr:hypothetical protein [Desulfobacteraceae bacterium]
MPDKFRIGDIRAERYTLHSHAEHGNEDKERVQIPPSLTGQSVIPLTRQ